MNALGKWNLVSYLIKTYELEGWAATGVIISGILLCMIVPYLIGSLNFGVIISSMKYKDDVRSHGSGNAGTTNMLRTYGKGAAVMTLLGDMLKAVVAVAFGYLMFSVVISNESASVVIDKPGAAVAGLFVMIGHMFPCYFHFKGGKGVATLAMVVLMMNPIVFAILMLMFIIIVAFTRFVSLGSVMGALLYPILLTAFERRAGGSPTACILAVVMGVLVVFMHRENIKRLLAGKESKISFKKKKPEGEAGAAPDAEADKSGKKKRKGKADAESPDAKEKDYQFVTCTGCGRLIPQSRRVCAYCSTENKQYVPDPDAEGKKNKKK